MGEEKFASLTSGLLARKGAAKPAMRRQGYMNPNGDVADDLGWNDMGYEPPRPVERDDAERINGEEPAVRRQFDELADKLNGEETAYAGPAHAGLTPLPKEQPLELDEGFEADETNEPAPDLAAEYGTENRVEADREAEAPIEEYGDDEAEREVPELADQAIAKIIPMRRPETDQEIGDEQQIKARDKVAFTLRLDKDRHLKLRLASAIENRSAQQLVTAALDDFFKAMPDLDRLAANAPDRS